MNRSAFEKRLAAGDRVLIDTSALIAYFEPADASHDVAVVLIDEFVKSGRNAAVLSSVTAMEVMVKPMRAAPKSVAPICDFLTYWPNLTLLPVDLRVALEAASLRARYGFKTPDALIVATGIVGRAGQLVTSDKEWRKKLAPIKGQVQVLEPHEFA